MSFWRRWFGRKAPPHAGEDEDTRDGDPDREREQDQGEDQERERNQDQPRGQDSKGREEGSDADAARRAQLARLKRVGRPGGFEVGDAIAILRAHEGMPEQTDDLHALVEGLEHPDVVGVPLDPLRVACASLLDDRGRRREALALVSPARSVPGMMLAAELHAAQGELPKAVSMIERVLARAIDTPGAAERHERWSSQLGRRSRVQVIDDAATVVAPSAAKSAFRLVREVARGGAGAVYEAEDELLGRRLAYKVYHRAEAERAHIEREARTGVRLAGPGVVQIYDADAEKGWLAMEWVGRGSLRDALKQGRVAELLPLSRWLPKLVAAVARVHDEGLVHSDLKPANVLFRDDDDPVLSDFGACQLAGEPGIAGTPGYMSPERLDGGAADPRDDVYAIGRIIEDVLGARDDAQLADGHVTSTKDEARRWASVALACLAPGDDRPANAREVLALADDGGDR
ncbi:MAG TPA: serine/threonine protein kinase, partial [Polyangiaceae bacterium]|nr:serine/threonine protein kinase [Polyangiaceae bacterium]